jgi:hypothetical protein
MKTNRELDVDVAKIVMGLKTDDQSAIPPYSTDQAAAQLVWDKMAEYCPGDIYTKFLDAMPSFVAREVIKGQSVEFLTGRIPPREICEAALQALL